MRILVTGSRGWDDEEAIADALVYELGPDPHEGTVVSGACPTGADALCEQVAEYLGATVERHPADWSKGRGAGPERNRKMVELGADVCLAFISNCTSPRCNIDGDHPSHGASGTADMAEAAGIPVQRFRP